MKRIAIINQKGGTGKTTSTVNIGSGLNRFFKKRVLLIDLDPQSHLTYSLGIQAHELERSVYDLLNGERVEDILIEITAGLKLIPANLSLSGKETQFTDRELLLKEALSGLRGYDYIIIDCAPSLNVFTAMALSYAREVYIPLQCEFWHYRA